MTRPEEQLRREAELVDWAQAAEAASWVATAVTSGLLGNAAWALLQGQLRALSDRHGGRAAHDTAAAALARIAAERPDVSGEQLVAIARALGGELGRPLPIPATSGHRPLWRVMVLYASAESAHACALHAALQPLPTFVAEKSVPPGAAWAQVILTALDTAEGFVVLTGPTSQASPYVTDELARGVERVRRGEAWLLPVDCPGGVSPLYGLAGIQAVKLPELGIEGLARLVRERLGGG